MVAGYKLNVCFYEAMKLFEALLKRGLCRAMLLCRVSAVLGLAVLGNGRWFDGFMVKNERGDCVFSRQ